MKVPPSLSLEKNSPFGRNAAFLVDTFLFLWYDIKDKAMTVSIERSRKEVF